MCTACRFPEAPGDWATAGSNGSSDALAARQRRLRIVEAALSQSGLPVSCAIHPLGVRLAGPDGRQSVARDLGEIWLAAEQLYAKSFDPLDPCFTQSGSAVR